jgi:hypothetical protein
LFFLSEGWLNQTEINLIPFGAKEHGIGEINKSVKITFM